MTLNNWDQRGLLYFPLQYQAFKQGHTIQYRASDLAVWRDCTGIVGQPAWYPVLQYRIKPEAQ